MDSMQAQNEREKKSIGVSIVKVFMVICAVSSILGILFIAIQMLFFWR